MGRISQLTPPLDLWPSDQIMQTLTLSQTHQTDTRTPEHNARFIADKRLTLGLRRQTTSPQKRQGDADNGVGASVKCVGTQWECEGVMEEVG